jgi:hypothetical protein
MTEPRNKVVQVRRFGDPDGLLCAYGYTAGVQARRRLATRSSAASASVAKAWVSGADQSQKRMASLAPAGGRPRRLNSDPSVPFIPELSRSPGLLRFDGALRDRAALSNTTNWETFDLNAAHAANLR